MASKRRVRRKSCERKVRYETREDAISASRSLHQSKANGTANTPTRAHGRARLTTYRCQFCGGWHIGHMVKR